MQKVTLYLAISLLSLCPIQEVSAFSLAEFFSGCSSVFSRPKFTYDQNKPCDGLNSKQIISTVLGVTGIVLTSIFGVKWYREKALERKALEEKVFERQALEKKALAKQNLDKQAREKEARER